MTLARADVIRSPFIFGRAVAVTPRRFPSKHQSGERVVARAKRLTAPMTKTQMFSEIAEHVDLSKAQVAAVFSALSTVIERHVKKGAVGHCTVPGLMKIKTRKKPAQKAKKNVPNPFRPGGAHGCEGQARQHPCEDPSP